MIDLHSWPWQVILSGALTGTFLSLLYQVLKVFLVFREDKESDQRRWEDIQYRKIIQSELEKRWRDEENLRLVDSSVCPDGDCGIDNPGAEIEIEEGPVQVISKQEFKKMLQVNPDLAELNDIELADENTVILSPAGKVKLPPTEAEKEYARLIRENLEMVFDTYWKSLEKTRLLSYEPGVTWERNYKFDKPDSQMELDFALPQVKIGVEINGGQGAKGNSGHSNWTGLERDAKKQNRAILKGWKIFWLTTSMLRKETWADHLGPIFTHVYEHLNIFEPKWEELPEEARWTSVDGNGRMYFFATQPPPVLDVKNGMWNVPDIPDRKINGDKLWGRVRDVTLQNSGADWKLSLRKRPTLMSDAEGTLPGNPDQYLYGWSEEKRKEFWDNLPVQFKYIALDRDGELWAYIREPGRGDTYWYFPRVESDGTCVIYKQIDTIEMGERDWENSLEKRPETEEDPIPF